MLDELGEDGRGEKGLAVVDATDGIEQSGGVGVFEEEASGSGAEGSVDVFVEFIHAEHEYAGAR